jgi:hypothetical protein
MNHRRLMRRWAGGAISLFGLIALLAARPQVAAAHSLDQYLQASYVTVAADHLTVELDLSPGVLVAPQILARLDPNRDGVISDAEGQAYARQVLADVALQIDSQPLALALTKVDMPPFLTVQAGYGTLRLYAEADLPAGLQGPHQLAYQNTHEPVTSIYQANAFVEKGAAITLGVPSRDDLQHTLTLAYTIGGGTTAAVPTTAPTTDAATQQAAALTAASGDKAP